MRKALSSSGILVFSGWLLSGCGGGSFGPPDLVVLVTIDTLRADHLQIYGYPRPTAPFLGTLADDGVVFENLIAASSHTAPSHASLFTGLYPFQHRVLRNGMGLDRRLLNIASVYGKEGYITSAFSAVRFLRGLGRGFAHFRSPPRKAERDTAETVFEDARRWVLGQDPDAKQFVWVHLFDVHEWRSHLDTESPSVWGQEPAPQRAAVEQRLFAEDGIASTYTNPQTEIRAAVDAYDEQITVVDRALKGFYEALTAAGRNDHAVWLVTADHGEGLGAHGIFGHGRYIYGQQLEVPFVLHSTEGRFPSQRVSDLVRHVDVAPTLADLAGSSLDGQIVRSPGRSLLPLATGGRSDSANELAFAQRRFKDDHPSRRNWESGDVFSLQGPRYKLILRTEWPDEFFDLSTDPEELTNLSGSGLAEEDRLRQRLLALKDRFQRDGGRVRRGEIDPEVVDELKALGYL